MPGKQQIGGSPGERLALIREQRKRQSGIVFRIVAPLADQVAILVVLDQSMVGVLRKGKRTQHERIERRQAQQPETRRRSAQVLQVEVDQVVAKHNVCAFGEVVEYRQGARERTWAQRLPDKRLAIRIDARQGTDFLRSSVDLKVESQVAHQRFRIGSRTGGNIRCHLHDHPVPIIPDNLWHSARPPN